MSTTLICCKVPRKTVIVNTISDEESAQLSSQLDRLTVGPEMVLIDTIYMDDKVAIQENPILHKPVAESIYLVYTDSIVVFDPEHYIEYVKITNRKVQLTLID